MLGLVRNVVFMAPENLLVILTTRVKKLKNIKIIDVRADISALPLLYLYHTSLYEACFMQTSAIKLGSVALMLSN